MLNFVNLFFLSKYLNDINRNFYSIEIAVIASRKFIIHFSFLSSILEKKSFLFQ